MNDHVVTGYIHKAKRRQRISHEMSLTSARYYEKTIKQKMVLAIQPWAEDIQIEKVN